MIYDLDELMVQRTRWRNNGTTVVWTNGCFDVLHVGHVRVLAAAKALGDVLVVGVNDDRSVRQLKGASRPFVSAEERAEVINALGSVDAVTIFSELIPVSLVARLQPDVYCKGGDYREEDVPEAAVVREYGGRVEFLPHVAHRSTSKLIERVLGAEQAQHNA